MTRPFELGRIETSVGTVDVLHRLALGVEPRDGITGRPAAGVRVGRETARSAHDARRRRRGGPLGPRYPAEKLHEVPGSRFLVRYTASVRPQVTIRLDDAGARWVPRRFDVTVRDLAAVAAADLPPGDPGALPPVPAPSRLLRPRMLPGPAYPLPRGATGARFLVTRGGEAVRWARVEVFGADGTRIGWAHGDADGQVLLVVSGTGAGPPPEPGRFDVVLRVHGPASAVDPDPHDRLLDLPVEPIPLSAVPPAAGDLDNDVLRGIALPLGYVTAPDRVRRFTVGELPILPDQPLDP